MPLRLSLVEVKDEQLNSPRIVVSDAELSNDNTASVKKMVRDAFATDATIKLVDLREKIKREIPGVSEAEIQVGFGDALRERNPNNPLFRGKEKGEKLFENADSSDLGYDYKITSTTARRKKTIGQKFMDDRRNAQDEAAVSHVHKCPECEKDWGCFRGQACREGHEALCGKHYSEAEYPRENAADAYDCPKCGKEKSVLPVGGKGECLHCGNKFKRTADGIALANAASARCLAVKVVGDKKYWCGKESYHGDSCGDWTPLDPTAWKGEHDKDFRNSSDKCAFAEKNDPCDGRIVSITEPDGSITKSCEHHMHTATNSKKFPSPLENESEEKYVERFMVDPFASGEFPSDPERKEAGKKEFKACKERTNEARCVAEGYGTKQDCPCKEFIRPDDWPKLQNSIGSINAGLVRERMNSAFGDRWPKPVTIKFITPGMVRYEDLGNNNECDVLVRKDVLDRMANSFVGKPVVNENHRKVAPGDYNLGNADGIVSKVWYNATDAYYYCDVLVWDPDTQRNMQNGYSASCAYTVKDWGEGGTHNNVPYDREVKEGEYTHMAIVSNPRYEEAHIFNSLKGGCMKLMKLLFKDKDGRDSSADLDLKTPVELGNGLTPTLEELVNTFHLTEGAKARAMDDSKLIDVGNGVKVKLADLKANYLTNKGLKNDDETDEEKKKREAKEKEEKDKEEAKNALENALKRDQATRDAAAAARLENAARMRKGELPEPHFDSIEDGLARGRDMFGFHEKLQPLAAADKK